tara:strand:- start:449 stop:646 length:198 start_codon:yes stop_codon:yes gene_type:complete
MRFLERTEADVRLAELRLPMIMPGRPGERAGGANTLAPFEASWPMARLRTERSPLVAGRLSRVME